MFDATITDGEIHRIVGGIFMNNDQSKIPPAQANHSVKTSKHHTKVNTLPKKPVEVGGPKGPEPTRYGDWEKAGRCTDF
jgi:hypothetical protein